MSLRPRLAAIAVSFISLWWLTLPAFAEVVSSRHVAGYCMDIKGSGTEVILWNCHGAANQNFAYSGYGQVRFNGMCMDTANGGSRSGTQQGDRLQVKACRTGGDLRSQRWGFDRNTKEFKNEEGWCASVDGQRRDKGTAIIAWSCVAHSSQQWFLGRVMPITQIAGPAADTLRQWDQRINAAGGNIVAVGGGNVLAPSTPNIVATGGGNVVATGGGNVVATGGGNVVAVGAGN